MLSLLSLFLTFILCNCLLFNIRLFSKLVGGGDIKAPFLEINIPRIVLSVLPPTKVNQASVPEKSQLHVFPHFFHVKPGQGVLRGSLYTKSVQRGFRKGRWPHVDMRRRQENWGLAAANLTVVFT